MTTVKSPIKIILVANSEPLAMLLSRAHFTEVARFSHIGQLEAYTDQNYHMVIIDVDTISTPIVIAIKKALNHNPYSRVVIITHNVDGFHAQSWLSAGAVGIVLYNEFLLHMTSFMASVERGHFAISSAILNALVTLDVR